MADYDNATYGDRIADIYDEWYQAKFDPGPAVEALAALAGPGPVLELGVGTGRVALPLSRRGLAVQGIDASAAMVAKLRAKPGGGELPVALGDFAEVAVEGRFSLVYVVFNTFFALLSQESQVRCFANVAARLADGGLFVIEAFVPEPARFDRGQRLGAVEVGVDRLSLEATSHDALNQRLVSQHVLVTGEGVRLYPVQLRYAWPSELDLMARLAGLELRERWEGWDKAAFRASSGKHISIYQRQDARG
jgi:SAM-dependent methyltransferase